MVLRSQSVGEQDVADQQGAFSRAEAPSPAAAGEGASGVRAFFSSFCFGLLLRHQVFVTPRTKFGLISAIFRKSLSYLSVSSKNKTVQAPNSRV